MRRRVFLSTLAWGAMTLFVRPLESMPPPFELVRKRIKSRAADRPSTELSVTSMGKSIASWSGDLKPGPNTPVFSNEKHGELRLSPKAPQPMTAGFQLLSALLTTDPLKSIEDVFGGIRKSTTRVESHGDRTLAYRFGDSPSVLVERESWQLLEVDIKQHEGHRWTAYLSYRPDATHPYMIRVTRDNRPAITARMAL